MISLDFDIHPSVATLTMRRPERRNALDGATVEALTGALTDLGKRDGLRVVILTGEGTVFSAGADLSALERLQPSDLEENLADSRRLAALFLTIVESPVPVLARVNGHAIAGGCGLVAACDIAVAVETARFGFTEVRIGFVPALVSELLVRRIPGAAVRDLLLTGRLVDAAEARSIGLVSRVVPAGGLDAAVRDVAVTIARETSTEAVATTKRLLLGAGGADLAGALDRAAGENARARMSRDCRDGVRAFLERTDPPWKAGWRD